MAALSSDLKVPALDPREQTGQGFSPLQIVEPLVSRIFQSIDQHHLPLDVLNEPKQHPGLLLRCNPSLCEVSFYDFSRRVSLGQGLATRLLEQGTCTPVPRIPSKGSVKKMLLYTSKGRATAAV